MDRITLKKSLILSRIAWLTAALFYAFQFFQRVAPSVMTDEISRHFMINSTELGTLSALFFLGYAIMQIPAGVALDYFSLRGTLAGGCAAVTIGTLLFATADHLYVAGVARFLMGVGSAVAFPGCLMIVSRTFSKEYISTFVGITSTIGMCGAICGELPFAAMLKIFSWKQCFVAAACFSGFLTVMLGFFVQNPAREERSTQEKGEIKDLIRNPILWKLAIFASCIVTPIICLGELWAIPFLEQGQRFSSYDASLILSFVFAGIAVGGPTFGWIEKKIGIGNALVLGCAMMFSVYLTFLLQPVTTPLLPFIVLFFLIGASASCMLLCFSQVSKSVPSTVRGIAVSLINTVIMISGALFQPLIGKILDLSWKGDYINGVPLYSLKDFQLAFSVVIPCILISLVTSFVLRSNLSLPKSPVSAIPKS